ncbi:MAG: KH domain-containing protein [Candidatus Krumholzibacteriota bacterium]|nr:KH domain-containing protein [Candidatus Krumholzibacteriota bacterium]
MVALRSAAGRYKEGTLGEVNKDTIKALIEFVATSLVDDKRSVKVKEAAKENYIVMELSVGSEDLGKVIGKNGQTARAIRTIVNAAASKAGEKIIFEIKE